MSPAPSLAGVGVLVTRPTHQAQRQRALIAAAGGTPVELPLLEIVETADPVAAARALAAPADLRIFTSGNAVEHAARLLPPPWSGRLLAAGPATARALARYRPADIRLPSGDGTPALLAMPELQDPRGLSVTIVCGQNPLPELGSALRRRGARVSVVAVYRRQPLAHSPARVSAALAQTTAAIVTSGEALNHLLTLTPSFAIERLLALQLAVPSARVARLALEAGFQHPALVPPRVEDEAFVRALVSWWRHQHDTSTP